METISHIVNKIHTTSRIASSASYLTRKKKRHYSSRKKKLNYETHTSLAQKHMAQHVLTSSHIRLGVSLILTFVLFASVLGIVKLLIFLFAGITVVYFFDLLFMGYIIIKSFGRSLYYGFQKNELTRKRTWPTYSIFCPLYKEANVLPQFVAAMQKLDYPKNKLQVMLLLEEDDKETIKRAQKMKLPSYFDIVIVPDSQPKTKPKACNYGLTKAKGSYVVIFDAEDIPEPDQLKKAVIAFEHTPKDVVCIQAKLNFYNPRQNILTRLFTAEYSLWFDLILTGMQGIQAPIPLGGTSNHFRKKDLVKLQGWDPFNVTEDCDLGIRIAKEGYQTAILDSTTWEEANSSKKNWIRQRSRWIKGYMQTYLVHIKNIEAFNEPGKRKNMIYFQSVIGGKILAMAINPLMWILTLTYFVFRPEIGHAIESVFPPYVFYMAAFSLVFGNFLYLYYYGVGLIKRGYFDLVKYIIFIPFYWLAMSYASWIALYQLIIKPHFWEKTVHGLHLESQKVSETISRSYTNTTYGTA